MSAVQSFSVTFSDRRRWRTTVEASSEVDAIEIAEQLWDADGVDGTHVFDLIDDCTFDQPEVMPAPEFPRERLWSVAFHRAAVFSTEVRARTENQAIAIAQTILFETDVAMYQVCWRDDTDWRADLVDGGASCR